MKQILILQAGRPKGNTARLSEAVAEGAREAGHRVEIVQLNTLDIRGCLGCNACRYQRPCVQRDDFAAVREKIEAADCLIFASAALLLDHLRPAQGGDRAVLLPGRRGPGPALWPV